MLIDHLINMYIYCVKDHVNFVTIAMCHLVLVHLNLADAISKS